MLVPVCHSALDAESRVSLFRIPVFTGMTKRTSKDLLGTANGFPLLHLYKNTQEISIFMIMV